MRAPSGLTTQDAGLSSAAVVRPGAFDVLLKPYAETEFLGKVQQMLGVRAAASASAAEKPLTSNEIFGDLLDDQSPFASRTRRPMKPTDDVDKLLADTLGGVMPQKRKETPPATPPPATAPAAPKQAKSDYDKALQDTLSGLEKTARKTSGGTTAIPMATPAPAAPKPAPVAPPPPAPSTPYATEKIALSSPLVTPTAAPAPAPVAEEEPTD